MSFNLESTTMKFVFAVLVILSILAVVADGGDIKVSNKLPPPIKSVPAGAIHSQEEFYFYARDFNAQQYADAKARRDANPPQDRTGDVHKASSKGVIQSRTTDAFGVPSDITSLGYGVYGGYGGYGAPVPNQNITRSESDSSLDYQMVWRDHNNNGGGRVTLINPYCYDYWKKHAN